MFLTTLGLLVERLALRATGGLSAGRSLALGSRVQADWKEQLRCRQDRGRPGRGRRRRLNLCSRDTRIGRHQASRSWCICAHTHKLSCTLLLPQHSEDCSHWLSHSEGQGSSQSPGLTGLTGALSLARQDCVRPVHRASQCPAQAQPRGGAQELWRR